MINAAITSFSEAIAALFQSFRLAFVLPAFIFLTLNAILVYPYFPQVGIIADLTNSGTSNKLAIMIALSFLLGYFLAIINIWLIRLFEGYLWENSCLARILVKQKQAQKDKLHMPIMRFNSLNELLENPKVEKSVKELNTPEFNELEPHIPFLIQELHERYPLSERHLLPTSLGNRIAAFEDYPRQRYNIDSVALWPRLFPILSKNKFALFVEREKAGFDFLLNLCFLLVIFAVELLFVGLVFDDDMFYWLLGSGIAVLLSFGFYKMSLIGVSSWGMAVRVAFDLYRYDLLAALYSRVPDDFGIEKHTWGDLSRFFKEGETYHEYFDYLKIKKFMDHVGIASTETSESTESKPKQNDMKEENPEE